MKLWLVLLGSLWLSASALFSFMLAAFVGGGLVNSGKLTSLGKLFLDYSLWVLPASSVFAMIMLWFAYCFNFGNMHYWWNIFPLGFILVYLLLLFILG